jgi:hypothetical protein
MRLGIAEVHKHTVAHVLHHELAEALDGWTSRNCALSADANTCTVKGSHTAPLITKGFFEQCQKNPKADSDGSKTSGPTFEARFADGTVTRMTTHCPDGKLDLGRGVRLARIAYHSRKVKGPTTARARAKLIINGPPAEPAAIEVGRFVERNDDGADTVLTTYTRDELNAVPAGRDDTDPQG